MGQMMSKHMKHLIPVIQMYLHHRILVRVRVTRSLVLCGVDRCPFVLFLRAIVLSVLLRLTDSDYPFGIFN